MSMRGWTQEDVDRVKREQGQDAIPDITPGIPPVQDKAGKYRAKPSMLAGRRFDSQLERDRAGELEMLMLAGEITDLQFQVQFRLSEAEIPYRADFVYVEDGRTVVEDTKGFETPRWRMVKKLWRAYGPALLRITKRGKQGKIVVTETIMPKR